MANSNGGAKSRSDLSKMTLAVIVGVIVILQSAVCTAEGKEPRKAQAPLVSASEIAYPPFCFVGEDGRASGFSVELLRAVLAAMGRDVTFRIGRWPEVRSWLERGDVQALPLVGRTPERESIFDFTFPYMSMHGAIVIRKGTTGILNLTDLKGRRVAVMKGDNAEEFLRREDRGFEILTTTTYEEALNELSRGRCDAVVVQRLVALRLIQKMGFKNLRVVNKPIEGLRQDFCFAVKEGDRDTLALLNEGLALVMANGTYRQLHAKWFAVLELPSHSRIVVGGDHNYPPYEYLDNEGRPAGFNVDLTRAIAKAVGLDIEIRLGPWTEIIQGLEKGEIDVIEGMLYSPERDSRFDFTQPYLVNHYVSVVRSGNGPPPESVEDLAGKRIVVQGGDIMQEFALENELGDETSVVDAQEDALRELVLGKYDCALVSRLTALYLIAKHDWTNLVLGRHPLMSPEYSYAFLKNRQALLASFSEGLKILEKTGEYRRIHDKWLSVYKEEPLSLINALRYSAMVLIPLVLILLSFFLWSWSLRKQVARKTAALQESERRMATLLGNLPGMAYRCRNDSGWTMSFVSDGCLGLTGYKPEEFTSNPGMSFDQIIHPEDRQHVRKLVEGAVANDEPFTLEYRIIDKSGDLKWVWERGRAVLLGAEDETRLEGFITDITERRRSEEALQDEAMRRRLLIDQSRDGIVVLDQKGKVYEANKRFCEMLGYSEKETHELHVWDWDARWGREHLLEMLRTVDESGDFFETRHQRKDGSLIDVEISTNGTVIGGAKLVFCVCRDITERKHAEQRIGHLNRVLRAIRDVNELIVRERDRDKLISEGCRLLVKNRGYSSALIVLTDENDRPVFWSESGLGETFKPLGVLLKQGGLPSCFAKARSAETLLRVSDRTRICGQCPIAGGCVGSSSLCTRLVHDNDAFGYLAVALEQGQGVDPEEQSLFAEMAEDLAYALYVMRMEDVREKSERERKSLQDQLLQAQKLEAVGRLAGGVAHDYNNMLGVIIGYAELAMAKMAPSNPLHPDLEEIHKAALRSAEITRQLLAFARKQAVAPKVLDLNETVEGMFKMLRCLIGEDISLTWLPQADLWPVIIDPAQVGQILANLCVNARDAIKGVGKVTIETANVTFEDKYGSDVTAVMPGEFVSLTVSDDGCGMDKETLNEIFEPFFTTKDVNQGTGLGLAMVYGIVKQNDGFINVYSELDNGTTFQIYLPRHKSTPETIEEAGVERTALSRGETVLLVEDEPAILQIGKLMLERLGYQVLPVSMPKDSIRLATDYPGSIDLLITDVVMPEMNGRELADQLRVIRPGLKILFMSGYTADAIAQHEVLNEQVNFIQKPFSKEDLAAKVRAALGRE